MLIKSSSTLQQTLFTLYAHCYYISSLIFYEIYFLEKDLRECSLRYKKE